MTRRARIRRPISFAHCETPGVRKAQSSHLIATSSCALAVPGPVASTRRRVLRSSALRRAAIPIRPGDRKANPRIRRPSRVLLVGSGARPSVVAVPDSRRGARRIYGRCGLRRAADSMLSNRTQRTTRGTPPAPLAAGSVLLLRGLSRQASDDSPVELVRFFS